MKKISATKISLMFITLLLSTLVIMLSFKINFEYIGLTIVIMELCLIVFVKSKYFGIWINMISKDLDKNKEILNN